MDESNIGPRGSLFRHNGISPLSLFIPLLFDSVDERFFPVISRSVAGGYN